MSCFCARSLANFLKSLLPAFELKPPDIPMPKVLQEIPSPPAALPSLAQLMPAFGAAARLEATLPPFPLTPLQLANLEGLAATFETLDLAGLNPLSPGAPERIRITIQSINVNLVQFTLPRMAPTALLQLAAMFSTMGSIRTAFGIDPLAPMAAPRLAAALDALVPPDSVPVPALNNISMYARMHNLMTRFGSLPNLLGALNGLVAIPLPPLTLKVPELAPLLAAKVAMDTLTGAMAMPLSHPKFMPTLAANMRAALPLEPIQVPRMAMPVMQSAIRLHTIRPALGSIQAMPTLALGPLVKLPILTPGLAPLSLATRFALMGNVAQRSSCSSSCPVGSML